MKITKRLSLWTALCLAGALCFSAGGCQGVENTSSQLSSQLVESESGAERETRQQSASLQSALSSSVVSQEGQESPSSILEEEYTQQEKLALQDLQSETGAFLLPGLTYDMPAELFLVREGQSLLAPRETQEYPTPSGSMVLTTYDTGSCTLEGQEFETSVTFQNGLLYSSVLIAQGEDLTALYQTLSKDQEGLFGVADRWEVGEVTDDKGNVVAESSLVTESQEEGGTTLTLAAQKMDGKVIQVSVTLSQGEE